MDTAASDVEALNFLDFTLVPASRQLLRGGRSVPIGDRAFDLLVLLTHHAGAVLSNRFLMQGVWPNTVVEENNVRAQIMTIRKILGGGAECAHIVNVTGRGYCFTAPVQKRNVVPMPELRLPRPHQFAQVTA